MFIKILIDNHNQTFKIRNEFFSCRVKNHVFVLQVVIQSHNRHMSFSAYIAALAVSDSIALLNGK